MVPFIYLIGLAAVTLFSSDMFDDREAPAARPLPPPSLPPPPPPPSEENVPRGINPSLFRRSAREVARELQTLFSQAYAVRQIQGRLEVINPAQAARLQDRLNQITTIARNDPWAAREYNRPEIRRFYYLTGNSNPHFSFVLHAIENSNDPFGEVRALVQEIFSAPPADLQHYQAKLSILSEIHQALSRIGISNFHEQWRNIIHEISVSDSLISNQNFRQDLNTLSNEDLRLLQSYLVQRMLENEGRENLHEVAILPPNLQNLLERHDIQFQRGDIPAIALYIGLLRSGQEAFPITNLPPNFQSLSLDIFNLRAQEIYTRSSPEPFDDLEFRNAIAPRFGNYLRRAALEDPLTRSSVNRMEEGLLLYHAICTPELRTRLPCAFISRTLLPNSENPDTFHTPLNFSEITAQSFSQGAIEFSIHDFAASWEELARQIHFDDSDETLWDFMEANVRSLILRPNIAQLFAGDESKIGTIDALTRSVVMRSPQNEEENISFFFGLIHESFHLYTALNIASQDANYASNPLLEERNAYLFQSKSIGAYLNEHGREISDHIFYILNSEYVRTRALGLATNYALGLREADDEIHFTLDHEVSAEIRSTYPTAHLEGYIRAHGYDNIEDFIDEMIRR